MASSESGAGFVLAMRSRGGGLAKEETQPTGSIVGASCEVRCVTGKLGLEDSAPADVAGQPTALISGG